jgi:exopolysaccharide biosynthesis polyprenyl glycosylphosphotransferase
MGELRLASVEGIFGNEYASGIGLSADALRQEETVRTTSWRRTSLLLIDLLCWAASLGLLWGGLAIFGRTSFVPNLWVFVLPGVVALIATALVRGYNPDCDFGRLRFAAEHLIAQGLASILGAAAVFMVVNYGFSNQPSRLLLLATGIPYWAFSLWIRRKFISRSPFLNPSRHLLLVGSEDEADTLGRALLNAGQSLRIEPVEAGELRSRLRQLTAFRQLDGRQRPPQFQANALSGVVIGPSTATLSPGEVGCLAAAHATSIPVYTWSNFFEQRLGRVDTADLHSLWLFDSAFRLAQNSSWWSLKRLFDLVTATVFLIFGAPLMLLIAVWIKLDSRGPVFFRQARVGFRGRLFTICKFRTMHVVQSHNGTTVKGDARITNAGRWLRKFRLDELPQFWNIFLGDMSLIGPRPEWTDCVSDYEKHIPFYHLRHLARPGLTGWAQVNYHYGGGREDAREKLAYDLFYIRNFSPTLDCSILLKTIYVVICGQGSR